MLYRCVFPFYVSFYYSHVLNLIQNKNTKNDGLPWCLLGNKDYLSHGDLPEAE